MKCDDAINERIIKIKEKTIKETSKYLKNPQRNTKINRQISRRRNKSLKAENTNQKRKFEIKKGNSNSIENLIQ